MGAANATISLAGTTQELVEPPSLFADSTGDADGRNGLPSIGTEDKNKTIPPTPRKAGARRTPQAKKHPVLRVQELEERAKTAAAEYLTERSGHIDQLRKAAQERTAKTLSGNRSSTLGSGRRASGLGGSPKRASGFGGSPMRGSSSQSPRRSSIGKDPSPRRSSGQGGDALDGSRSKKKAKSKSPKQSHTGVTMRRTIDSVPSLLPPVPDAEGAQSARPSVPQSGHSGSRAHSGSISART